MTQQLGYIKEFDIIQIIITTDKMKTFLRITSCFLIALGTVNLFLASFVLCVYFFGQLKNGDLTFAFLQILFGSVLDAGGALLLRVQKRCNLLFVLEKTSEYTKVY